MEGINVNTRILHYMFVLLKNIIPYLFDRFALADSINGFIAVSINIYIDYSNRFQLGIYIS